MARELRRRDVVVGGITVGVTAPWLLAGCGDDGDEEGPAAGGAGDLLADLESSGHSVFEQLYSSTTRDGVALVVGTTGAGAVGYLCDPAGPALWFSGTVEDGTLALTAAGGAALTGTVDAGSIDCRLVGSEGHDGEYRVEAGGEVTLARQSGVDDGAPVGGLIIDGFVATGSFTAPTFQPQLISTTSSTVTSLRLGLEGATIGLRVAAGSTLDLSVTVTPGRALSDRERTQLQELLRANQTRIQEALQRITAARREAEAKDGCLKIVSIVAAVVIVVVAVVLAAFTFGAVGGLVALATIAASAIVGASVSDLDGAAVELGALMGASLAAAEQFVAANDRTTGQLILQTLRQAKGQTTTSSSSTTTTVPPRPFPSAGNISLVLR